MLDKQTSLNETRAFVAKSWDTLTRTLTRSETYGDPKTDDEPILYLPKEVPEPDAIKDLQLRCRIDVRRLPELVAIPGDVDLNKIENEGLLYLEHPYVVPGGQFNEMYGWDSYFIILGLLRDERCGLAKGMVENFFFELDHYGSILNANRTYYLTRSQPPFLTSMVLALFEDEIPLRAGLGLARTRLRLLRPRLYAVDQRTTPRRGHRALPLFRSRRWAGSGNHGQSQ